MTAMVRTITGLAVGAGALTGLAGVGVAHATKTKNDLLLRAAVVPLVGGSVAGAGAMLLSYTKVGGLKGALLPFGVMAAVAGGALIGREIGERV